MLMSTKIGDPRRLYVHSASGLNDIISNTSISCGESRNGSIDVQ